MGEAERILGRQARGGRAERHEPERGPEGAPLDHRHPFGKERRVAAKPVDDKTPDHGGVGGIEHGAGSDDLGDDAAAINVADEDHGGVGGARESHIRNVVLAQVDLGRASRALRDDEIGIGAEPRETLQNRAEKLRLQLLIIARGGGADDAPAQHHLCAGAALRLQEHRVHVDRRLDAAGPRLQRLRAADLAAIGRHCGVVRHVLRLERQDPEAAIAKGAAEAGDDQGLADVRSRALDHQGLRLRNQNSMPCCALTPGREMMPDQGHLGDEIGGLDQLRLRVAAGRDDVQIAPAPFQRRDHLLERQIIVA